jgi:hypothetical protein
MKDYILYDSSGEIQYSGSCQDGDFDLQDRDGLTLIEGSGSYFDHYVLNGVLTPYSPTEAALKLHRPMYPATWNNASMSWDDLRSLAEIKVTKWNEIKAARTAADYSPITVGGHTFDANQESQQKIAGAVQLALIAGSSFTLDWTLTDNTVETLTQAEMIQVGVSLGQRTSSIYSTARVLREQIEAAKTAEDVLAVVW